MHLNLRVLLYKGEYPSQGLFDGYVSALPASHSWDQSGGKWTED